MKKIGSLTVLKFVAMFLIVWWHIGMPTRTIDLGGRMCEFLFVASGFLVGYNYYRKGMEDSRKFSFDYTFGKIKKAWPLHVLCLFAFMILNFRTCILNFSVQDIPMFLSNLFLLQAWQPDWQMTPFSYNGVSWFLSALFFCYFLSPLFIKFIKKISTATVSFFAVASVRLSIDFFISKSSNIFMLIAHTSPIVRCLEFFMGMLLVPLFFKVKEKSEKVENKVWFKSIATVLEVGALVALYFVLRTFNETWERSYFVLVFCLFTFMFAFDYGYFSKICSNKYIAWWGGVELEMYLMQIVVSQFVDKCFVLMHIQIGFWWLFLIKVALLITLSIIYKKFIEGRLAKPLDKFYNFAKRKLFVTSAEVDQK